MVRSGRGRRMGGAGVARQVLRGSTGEGGRAGGGAFAISL